MKTRTKTNPNPLPAALLAGRGTAGKTPPTGIQHCKNPLQPAALLAGWSIVRKLKRRERKTPSSRPQAINGIPKGLAPLAPPAQGRPPRRRGVQGQSPGGVPERRSKGRFTVKQILVVEDDLALSRGIVLALSSSEMQLTEAHNLLDAEQLRQEIPFDLILLDCGLPDGSGLGWCAKIRRECNTPVIFLTANDTEYDEVAGLEAGADDYITKPFSLAVLRARVANILRRQDSSARIAVDGFVFDFETLSFTRGGEPLELSKTEQKVLQLLVRSRGSTVPRERLLDRVWGDSDYVDENALSVTIRRLRSKLEENPGAPRYIKTVYGIGYTWAVKP